ncbi:MAG: hypothetical protein ACRD6X_05925 [Pyrinomonadaceae bacterium]
MILSVFICVHLWLIFLTSCSSKPADLRTLIPADSLVYLESNDLGAVMNAITERPAFREVAKTIPDFSILNGVKLAVAVTGFESKEIPVTDENAILNFTPRFVAVLETNAWNYQAIAFTEHKLGEFINQVYGGGVLLETSDKQDGKYFVWSSNDGRRAFALVQGSVVFFGNNETSIEKCLAVKRGEAEPISKNPKITNGDRLAFGYVSPDGVAQIANLVSIKLASEASDEPEVRRSIVSILPRLIRNSFSDVSWAATKTEKGIEDNYLISMPPDIANVLNETIASANSPDLSLLDIVPINAKSVTLYNLKDPQVAWRSIVLTAQKQTDIFSAEIIAAFTEAIFDSYGIRDPEKFLSAVGSTIVTAKMDENGEKPVTIATIARLDDLQRAVSSKAKELADDSPHEMSIMGSDIIGVSYVNNRIHLGDVNSIIECIAKETNNPIKPQIELRQQIGEPNYVIVTVGKENSQVGDIVSVLVLKNSEDSKAKSDYKIESRFTKQGIERRTVSDFGFIGWIITQFGKDE